MVIMFFLWAKLEHLINWYITQGLHMWMLSFCQCASSVHFPNFHLYVFATLYFGCSDNYIWYMNRECCGNSSVSDIHNGENRDHRECIFSIMEVSVSLQCHWEIRLWNSDIIWLPVNTVDTVRNWCHLKDLMTFSATLLFEKRNTDLTSM